MSQKNKKPEKPHVDAALEGFDVQINEFGEIISSYDLNKLNEFLDSRVDDKKFRGVEVKKRQDEPQEEFPRKAPLITEDE